MTLSLIIGLILFGVLLILIEIFVTPGFIVGVLGAASLTIGILYTYKEYGSYYGNISISVTGLCLGLAIILAFRNGAWKRFAIEEVIEGKANNSHNWDIEVGDLGISISALRPAGSAFINGQKIEVHTDGDFILANEEIQVTKCVNNKIFIKKVINK